MVFPVLVGVVGIAAATVCVVSLDDDSLTVKLKTTDKTNFLSHEQLSQKVLLNKKILRFFSFSFFSFFSFSFSLHFHLRLRQNSFPLSFLFFFPLLCSVILKI
tara:strand:- start:28 stop:336 length:309 start_codon:yes stop_codon:yes gene_type:complete